MPYVWQCLEHFLSDPLLERFLNPWPRSATLWWFVFLFFVNLTQTRIIWEERRSFGEVRIPYYLWASLWGIFWITVWYGRAQCGWCCPGQVPKGRRKQAEQAMLLCSLLQVLPRLPLAMDCNLQLKTNLFLTRLLLVMAFYQGNRK